MSKPKKEFTEEQKIGQRKANKKWRLKNKGIKKSAEKRGRGRPPKFENDEDRLIFKRLKDKYAKQISRAKGKLLKKENTPDEKELLLTIITASEKQLSELKQKWQPADSNIENNLPDSDIETSHGVNCEAFASGTKTTGLDSDSDIETSHGMNCEAFASGTKTTGLDSGDNCEDFEAYLIDTDDEDTNNVSSFTRQPLNRLRKGTKTTSLVSHNELSSASGFYSEDNKSDTEVISIHSNDETSDKMNNVLDELSIDLNLPDGCYPTEIIGIKGGHLVYAKDQRNHGKSIIDVDILYHAYLIHVKMVNQQVVEGLVQWQEFTNKNDMFAYVKWEHITNSSDLGRSKRKRKQTKFYSPNLTKEEEFEKMKKGKGPESKLIKMMDQFAKGEVPSATKAFVKVCDDDEFALNVLCTCSSSIDVTFLVLTQNPKMLMHAYYK